MPPAHGPGGKKPPAGAGGKAGALPPPEPALRHRALAALFVALLSLAGLLGFNIEAQRAILVVIYSLLAGATGLWLAAVMLMAFSLFGQQLSDYGRCLSGANTIAASQSCYSHFSHALDRAI